MSNYFLGKDRPLYRSRKGVLFGVCQGLANWSELNVGLIRLAFIISCALTSSGMLLVYFVLAFLMKPEPVITPSSSEDTEFYNSLSSDRKSALIRLQRKLDSLDRRTRRMENTVTQKEFDWERRFHRS